MFITSNATATMVADNKFKTLKECKAKITELKQVFTKEWIFKCVKK